MRVNVHIKKQSVFFLKVIHNGFHCKHRRFLFRCGNLIISVEVQSLRIQSIVALVDSIRIQHRHDQKYKKFSEQISP